MYKSPVLRIFIFLVITLVVMPCNVLAFSVIELSPKANYPLTNDPFDALQLVDGKLMKYPIWLHKEAVGWNGRSPVNIKIELTDDEVAKFSTNSMVKIHTAVGKYAGVQNIQRIDVYSSRIRNSNYDHVGSYVISKKHSGLKKQSYSIDVDVSRLSKFISIVIHVDKGGIFMDELDIVPCNKTTCTNVNMISKISVGLPGAVDHSRLLLKESIKSTVVSERKLKTQTSALTNKTHIVWYTDCYKEFDWLPVGDELSLNKEINLTGYDGENVDICIGIANLTSKETSIEWSASDRLEKEAKVYQVNESFIRTGGYVYDHMSLLSSKDVIIKPLSTTYLWYQMPLNALPKGKSTYQLRISGIDDFLKTFRIALNNNVCGNINDPLDLNVWSYSVNKPIWANKEETIKHLHTSGVNYFTVHPSLVPKLDFKGWNIKKGIRFVNELELYRGKGTILIVPGWNLKDIGFIDEKMSIESVTRVKKWINNLSNIITENDFSYSDWALYIIDEPFGEKLEFLKFIAQHIKKANKNIQIYANPSYSRRNHALNSDLKYLNEYVDIWQPSWNYYIKTGGRFFDELDKKWMIYRNPEYPAKAAVPEFDYRYMAWRASAVGATGIGVWSYDDTQGSSAIDDFDGIRSDWSMMYESMNYSPSPSRRWLALLKGIDDIKLISNNLHEADKKKLKSLILSKKLDNIAVNEFRDKALNDCQ